MNVVRVRCWISLAAASVTSLVLRAMPTNWPFACVNLFGAILGSATAGSRDCFNEKGIKRGSIVCIGCGVAKG